MKERMGYLQRSTFYTIKRLCLSDRIMAALMIVHKFTVRELCMDQNRNALWDCGEGLLMASREEPKREARVGKEREVLLCIFSCGRKRQ